MDTIISPQQPMRSSWIVPILAFILSFALVAALYIVRGNQYVQTRLSLPEDTYTETVEEVGVDQVEEYCHMRKMLFIGQCGDLPGVEGDYNCRTTQADQVEAMCEETTTQEDLDQFYQTSSQDTL